MASNPKTDNQDGAADKTEVDGQHDIPATTPDQSKSELQSELQGQEPRQQLDTIENKKNANGKEDSESKHNDPNDVTRDNWKEYLKSKFNQYGDIEDAIENGNITFDLLVECDERDLREGLPATVVGFQKIAFVKAIQGIPEWKKKHSESQSNERKENDNAVGVDIVSINNGPSGSGQGMKFSVSVQYGSMFPITLTFPIPPNNNYGSVQIINAIKKTDKSKLYVKANDKVTNEAIINDYQVYETSLNKSIVFVENLTKTRALSSSHDIELGTLKQLNPKWWAKMMARKELSVNSQQSYLLPVQSSIQLAPIRE